MNSLNTFSVEFEGAGHSRLDLPLSEAPANPKVSGQSLADQLANHGFALNTRCGQRGLCHGCEVHLLEGIMDIGGKSVTAPAIVRACQARPDLTANGIVIRIPTRSRVEHYPQVEESFRIDIPFAHLPLIEPTDTRDIGFAIDVGTTTVVVLLVDLVTGEILSRAGGLNAQVQYGDNVLARIDAARRPGALEGMRAAVVTDTITPLLAKACERAGREPSRLAGGTVAGNTTMLHVIADEDPTPMGVAPFAPRFIESRRLDAAGIGLAGTQNLAIAPDAPIQLLPGIAAYVGADITAGLIASGMVYGNAPRLFVDIGTNGEMLLLNGQQLTACATAAGPAFEGAGLSCGVRAHHGAIDRIALKSAPFRVETETIGNVSPASVDGLCGSAYIDFLATGRRQGLLLGSGRFNPDAWMRVPSNFRLDQGGNRALRITGNASVSETDIAVLLQAKAAIAAGIETLLQRAGLHAADIEYLYLAGGFGMHLRVGNAIATGLLPGFRADQVRIVGNTSLAGALLALLDRTTLEEMESLCSRVEVIELNLQEGFEDCYIDHLSLP